MSIKIILSPYEDPAGGVDWPEQTPIIINELKELISNYSEGQVEYTIEETDHGISADFPTVFLEIIKIGGWLLFAIPALHKKIRETISEWKEVKKAINNFIKWLKSEKRIISYSIEVAFLEALEYLEKKENIEILNLEMIEVREISGKSGSKESGFKTSPLLYYLFIFRENDEKAHIVLFDSMLRMILYHSLNLDLRVLIEDY